MSPGALGYLVSEGLPGLVDRIVERLTPAGGDLRGELGTGQQCLSSLDRTSFRFGHRRPGLQPGAVARRGGRSDEPGGQACVLACQGQRAERAQAAGQAVEVVLDRTPFYGESGGQVGDTGTIRTETGVVNVDDTFKPTPDLYVHRGTVAEGFVRSGERAHARIDAERRRSIVRNHTATHLLHRALRIVLGEETHQAGSLVAPDRLRFDFAHMSPVTPDELLRIERIVNDHIVRNTAVVTEVKSTEEAIARGAMALFGEKYGDQVRVVSIPGFSMELCGGTHVRATGDIGLFVITEESGVAAGVRRIEALTGTGAVAWVQQQRQALDGLLAALHTSAAQGVETVQRLQADSKRLAREVEQLKMKVALGGGQARSAVTGSDSAPEDDSRDVAGIKLVTRRVEGLEKGALRGLSDSLRDRLGSGVVVLASEVDGKVALVVSVSKDLTGRVQAGRIVKELAPIVGGGGGGRPDFAEAGGKDASKIDELLSRAPDVLASLLAA